MKGINENIRPHTWAWIRPRQHVEAILESPLTKYDKNFFGLPFPKRAFNVIKLLPDEVLDYKTLDDKTLKKGFETEERARQQDRLRAQDLRMYGGRYGQQIARLLDDAEKRERPYPTLASSWWSRNFRLRILGEELKALAPYADSDLYFVTLINKNWKIRAGDLHLWSARKIMESFRQHLNRSGTTAAKGILFAWLHGEYDPMAGSYRLHVHVVVQGDKSERLRTLKGRWGYETVAGETKRPVVFEKVKAPVWKKHTTRKQPPSQTENIARVLSYTHQSFWPFRRRYYAGNMKRHKSVARGRLPGPQHAETLIWLFQQRPTDLMIAQPNIRIKRQRTR